MGIVLPETCWACNKICNKYHLFHLVGILFPHKLLIIKCVSIFRKSYVWKVSHYKKKWVTYDQKFISIFKWNTRYSCQILMKLEFHQQIFRMYSSTKFLENPSSRNLAEWQADVTKLIVTVRNFAKKPKNEFSHGSNIFMSHIVS